MDAHGTVTAEEWGSLPPKTAKFYFGVEASMVMQLTVNQPPNGTTGSIPVHSTNFMGAVTGYG